MLSCEIGERGAAQAALEAFESNACDVAQIDEHAVRALLTAAVRLYAARVESTGMFAGVERDAIAATDALVTASTLLRSVSVAPFELGLWEAWGS
jgi:hypothetical protein